jgi:hypothetical protein
MLSTDCPVSKISGPIRRVIVRLSLEATFTIARTEAHGRRTCAIRNNLPNSPRSSRTAGLLLAGRSLDQGRGLACVSLVLKAEHR